MSDDFTRFVMLAGDMPVTDSRRVATHFGKDHRKVTRTIAHLLEKTGAWGAANFGRTPYVDPQNGQTYAVYRMTKDGFMLLVMRFTGDKALQMQIQFIEAFDAMANYIKRREENLWKQMHELEKRDAASFERASFGSKLMLDRKRELPGFDEQRFRLNSMIQLPLFDNGGEDARP